MDKEVVIPIQFKKNWTKTLQTTGRRIQASTGPFLIFNPTLYHAATQTDMPINTLINPFMI